MLAGPRQGPGSRELSPNTCPDPALGAIDHRHANRLWVAARGSIDFGHDRDPAAHVHDDAAAAGRRRTGQAGARGSRGQLVEAVGARPAPMPSTARSPARRSTRSTPRRRRCRGPCTSAASAPTPTTTSSPATSGCGAGGLLPDRLGRQRPADRAPGAELLRRPVRPDGALRPRLHAAREARPEAPGADQPPELHRALRAAHRRGRGGLRGAVPAGWGCPWTGHLYRTIGEDCHIASQRAFLRNLSRGEAYLAGRTDAVGRQLPVGGGAGRAGGHGSTRGTTTASRSTARRAGGSRRPGPS